MNVAIAGASGFIATYIRSEWISEQFTFYTLKRDDTVENWTKIISDCDVIVNLAGAPIVQRWTKHAKREILYSRVNTTRKLISVLNSLTDLGIEDEKLLISASAIGIYPNDGITPHDESSVDVGKSFLSKVVSAWEEEAMNLSNPKVRLVIPRIGIVLHRDGGILKKLIPLFKLGIGGRLASGKQKMSFIHIYDIQRAFKFFVDNKQLNGIFNLVAPTPTTNAEFTASMAKVLHRKAFFHVPAVILKIALGRSSEIMVKGENVIPKRLMKEGFSFRYSTIDIALYHSIYE